jgi:hypothetical protein
VTSTITQSNPQWRAVCIRLAIVALTSAAVLSAGMVASASTVKANPVVGDWNVTYGNQAIVKIVRSGNGYAVVSKTPVQLGSNGTPTSSCYLPQGTLLATFSGTSPTYSGQHGLWYNSNCSFGVWDQGSFSLSSATLTFTSSNGYGTVVFTKVTAPPTPSLRSMGLLTWQTVENGVSVVESCTATIVDSPNRSTVVTAAHCFNPNDYSNLQFAPAHTGSCLTGPDNANHNHQAQVSQCGSNPYGVWYANSSNVYISSSYRLNPSGPSANDFAFVVLARDPANGPVQDLVGGFPLVFDPNANTALSNDPEAQQTWRIDGYAPRDEQWATQVTNVGVNPQGAGSTYYEPFACDETPSSWLNPYTGHWNDSIASNCDFIDPLSGAEVPFQMPPLSAGLPAGASGSPWTNSQNAANGAYAIGAVQGAGACTGACGDPNGTYQDGQWANVLGSHARQLFTQARSAPVPVRQAYTCSPGGAQEVTVSGKAKVNNSTGQVVLSQVTFAITNPTGVAATVTGATIHVPDPNPVAAPYVDGSASVAGGGGWTAGHNNGGLYVSFSGSLTLGPGETVSTPPFGATYTEAGPTGTKLAWQPGPGSITTSAPSKAVVACSPTNPVAVFARVHW